MLVCIHFDYKNIFISAGVYLKVMIFVHNKAFLYFKKAEAEVTECLLTRDTRVVPCNVLVYLVSGTYWSITVASKIKPASNSQVSYTLLSPAKRFERDLNMSQAFKAKKTYSTHCCLFISLKYIDLAIHSGHIFDENKVKLFS